MIGPLISCPSSTRAAIELSYPVFDPNRDVGANALMHVDIKRTVKNGAKLRGIMVKTKEKNVSGESAYFFVVVKLGIYLLVSLHSVMYRVPSK